MTYNVSMGTLNPTIPYHTNQPTTGKDEHWNGLLSAKGANKWFDRMHCDD